MSESKTVAQLLVWGGQQLECVTDTPKLESRVLFRFISKLSDVELITHANKPVAEQDSSFFQQIIQKRKQGTPVAYLTGTKEFWSLKLTVTADTLIPRPETELVVEQALKLLQEDSGDVLDLGTGSGAIALAIAVERRHLRVTATDNSVAALDIAAQNAKNNDIVNVQFILSNWFDDLSQKHYDMIVSNPPYISSDDSHLSQGDVQFEPINTLESGPDGLDDLKIIIVQAKRFLLPNGWLLVEHGYNQEQAVRKMFARQGYENIKCHQDLNHQPRVTSGQTVD